jgi:hypothetical protein
MADVRDVVAYLVDRYPHARELSKARLTKMVYLADWKSSVDRGRQMTPVSWVFNHYGPYVAEVVASLADDPSFSIEDDTTLYGSRKSLIRRRAGRPGSYPSLDDADIQILDHVIESTQDLYWDSFIKLVYGTYPVLSQARYRDLDLPRLAERYRREIDAAGLEQPRPAAHAAEISRAAG